MGTVTSRGGGGLRGRTTFPFEQVCIHPASGFSLFFCAGSPFPTDSSGSCTSSVRN